MKRVMVLNLSLPLPAPNSKHKPTKVILLGFFLIFSVCISFDEFLSSADDQQTQVMRADKSFRHLFP